MVKGWSFFVLLTWLITHSLAYAPSKLAPSKLLTITSLPLRKTRTRVPRCAAPSRRWATVYDPSSAWEKGRFESHYDVYSTYTDNIHSQARLKQETLLERLGQYTSLATLARLAAAFCPTTLALRDIAHVSLLTVDEHHVDLQAVVCEHDGCVTLSVPIVFPHECPLSNNNDADTNVAWEECVTQSLHILDEQALEKLALQEYEDNHKDVLLAAQVEIQQFQDDALVSWPDWWEHPSDDDELRQECKSIRQYLNEPEFASELKALGTYALVQQGYDDLQINQVAALGVSPQGLYLRIEAHEHQLFQEETDLQYFEIPIRFREPQLTAPALREAVLAVVASAADYVE